MNSSQIWSIVRALLAASGPGGAWLMSKGLDPSMVLTIIEALATVGTPIVAAIWGGLTHSNTNQVKAAAAVPGVTIGVNPSQAPQAVVDVAHDPAQPKVLVTTPR